MCNGLAYASTCSSAFSTMAAMFRMTVVLHRGSRNANPTYIWQSQSVCVQLFDCRGEASVSAPRPDTSAGRYLHRMTSGKSGAHDADGHPDGCNCAGRCNSGCGKGAILDLQCPIHGTNSITSGWYRRVDGMQMRHWPATSPGANDVRMEGRAATDPSRCNQILYIRQPAQASADTNASNLSGVSPDIDLMQVCKNLP